MRKRTKVMALAAYVVAMGAVVAAPVRAEQYPTCTAGFYNDPDPDGMCYNWVSFQCELAQPGCGLANIEYSYCGSDGTMYCSWAPS